MLGHVVRQRDYHRCKARRLDRAHRMLASLSSVCARGCSALQAASSSGTTSTPTLMVCAPEPSTTPPIGATSE